MSKSKKVKKEEFNLENMSLDELDTLKVKKEKELRVAKKNKATINHERLSLEREIIVLQGKKKDFQIALNMSKNIIDTLTSEIQELDTTFWSLKREIGA